MSDDNDNYTRAARALAFIRDAGRPVTTAEVAQHLGLSTTAQGSSVISSNRARACDGWEYVHAIRKGVFEYQPDAESEPPFVPPLERGAWTQVGDSQRGPVLRSPDGEIYVAVLLDTILPGGDTR